MKLCDLFNLSMVSKKFYHISTVNKRFTSAMTFSKCILNFGTNYFELRCLDRKIRKSLKKGLLKIPLSFHLLILTLKRLFMICYHSEYFVTAFFCVRGSKTVGKCDVCSRFFVDDLDIVSKID